MGRKKKTVVSERGTVTEAPVDVDAVATEGPDEVVATDTTDAAAPETPKSRGKRKAANVGVTLAQAAEGYLRWLEDEGKSQGTVFSYRLELVMALSELGTETAIADLTTERVQAFFDSDRVCKTRTGVEKARVSVLKTRRVVRQMLVWAEGAGLVEKAPVPVTPEAA